MERLKIAFYTDNYLPIKDGVVNQIICLRKELERRGHKVFIITAGDEKTKELAKKDKHLIVLSGLKFIDKKSTFALDPSILLQVVNGQDFDIIHAHSPFIMGLSAAFVSRFTKAKLVSTFHTHFFNRLAMSKYVAYFSKALSSNRFFLAVSKAVIVGYLKLYYKACACVITPSKFAKRLLTRRGIKNVEVIENGIELKGNAKMTKSEARNLLGIPKKDKIVLYLGRISKEKNIDFLIRRAKLLEKAGFKLIIAGDGPQLEEYKMKCFLHGINSIYFPGFVEEKEKEYYYRAADVFCNPSTFETSCVADMEAMSYNLPILAPRNSAQAEFMEQAVKCGELFNLSDKKEFLEKLNKITKSRRSYSPMNIVRRFNVKIAVDRLITLYRRIISNSNSTV